MREMRMSEIHENARRCVELHGDKAEVVARQKAEECEQRGNQTDALHWRRIRAAIIEMRAPHHS